MRENQYTASVEFLAEKFKLALAEESPEINDRDFQEEEEEPAQNKVAVYSLSEVPFDKIQKFKVSKVSTFEDVIWDWRHEGSPLYKDRTFYSWNKDVSEGVSLLSQKNIYLCRLLKMIGFYFLPQNACLQNIRSFNTSMTRMRQLLLLGKFLYKNKLFVDIYGNGCFNGTAYLRREHFIDYLENDLKDHRTKYDFAKQVKNWIALSKNKLIPIEYRLEIEPFDSDMYSRLYKNKEENKGTYLPISLDTLSELVPYCVNMIEQYSQDILKIYNVLWPIIAGGKVLEIESFSWSKAIDDLLSMNLKIWDLNNFKSNEYSEITVSKDMSNKIRSAIKKHPNWDRINPIYTGRLTQIKQKEQIEIALKLGIDLEALDKEIVYDLPKLKNEAMSVVTELRNSCVAILFLVTGMRNSEMYLLEVSNCWHIKGSEDDFRIKITVSKTSDASSGDPVILPVPEIAFKAFKCLESLTEKARAWGKSNRLMINPTVRFGKEISIKTIGAFLKVWCEDLGIEHIHPHMFRKTIAMFAIYQDPNSIGLIRRLFSHKSLAMTLAYIIKMPGMDEEIKLAVIEQNKQLISELLEAIDKKCIGGKAGNRIKGVIDESKKIKANLYDDGWETLEEYVEILLQDGLKILHRTSFGAICTNTHSGLVHLGPETCSCNVVDCDWAVFTENSIEDLENDIKFHQSLLAKDLSSEEQKQFSRVYIKNCIERLVELKGRDVVSEQFPELINTGA